ncbi:MAG: hypothetical protein ACYTGH_06015 [Planctomycetota bacterium]|jgi:hypothetical protein
MFTVDDLGLLLSQPSPRQVPEAVKAQLTKPAYFLGCGCGCLLSLFMFPFGLVLPILVYMEYKKNLDLIQSGHFAMAQVIKVGAETSTITLELDGGDRLNFIPYFKRKRQVDLALGARRAGDAVGLLYLPDRKGAVLLPEALVEME